MIFSRLHLFPAMPALSLPLRESAVPSRLRYSYHPSAGQATDTPARERATGSETLSHAGRIIPRPAWAHLRNFVTQVFYP